MQLLFTCNSSHHGLPSTPSFQEFQMPIFWSPLGCLASKTYANESPSLTHPMNGFTTPPHSVIYARNFQNILHITLSINHIQIFTTCILTLATNSTSLPFPPPPKPSVSGFHSASLHHMRPGDSKCLCTLPPRPGLPFSRICVQSDRLRA